MRGDNRRMTKAPPTLTDSHRWRGLRVGLLGGSFNPPHDGHLHIARRAARALRLDAVWWMVTPQNPLKDSALSLPYDERLRLCRSMIAAEPDMVVTDIERRLSTTRTVDTISALRRRYAATDFVLVTGMDNALSLHRWYRWRALLGMVATAHIARPPATALVENCPLRMLGTQNHVTVTHAADYRLRPYTSFWIMQMPMRDISSTNIRNISVL